jgi:hypothetical protein
MCQLSINPGALTSQTPQGHVDLFGVTLPFYLYVRLNEDHKSTGQQLRLIGSSMEKHIIFQPHCKPEPAGKDSKLRDMRRKFHTNRQLKGAEIV